MTIQDNQATGMQFYCACGDNWGVADPSDNDHSHCSACGATVNPVHLDEYVPVYLRQATGIRQDEIDARVAIKASDLTFNAWCDSILTITPAELADALGQDECLFPADCEYALYASGAYITFYPDTGAYHAIVEQTEHFLDSLSEVETRLYATLRECGY